MADKKSDAKYTPTRSTLSAQSTETEAVPNEPGATAEGKAAQTEPGQADDGEDGLADDQHPFTSKYTPTRVEIIPEGAAATLSGPAPHHPKKVQKGRPMTIQISGTSGTSPTDLRIVFTSANGDPIKIVGKSGRTVHIPAGAPAPPLTETVKAAALHDAQLTVTAKNPNQGPDPSDDIEVD